MPAQEEPPRKTGRRSFSPEWKALRLYFGTAVAGVLVFFIISRLAPDSPSRGEREMSYAIDEKRMQEIHAQAAYEVLMEAQEEQRLREVAVPLSSDAVWLSSPGAVTVPVNRSIGTARSVQVFDLAVFDQPAEPESAPEDESDSEPETVPAGGDDERIVLDEFTVTASTEAGYRATATLAGTRVRTELRDIGSAVTFASVAAGNVGGSSGSARSSYREGHADSPTVDSFTQQPAETAWAAGFTGAGPAPSDVVHVVAAEHLRDTGATSNGSALGYASGTQVQVAAKDVVSARDGSAPARGIDPAPVRAKQAPALPVAIDEAHAAKEPVSTFSLHVSDASFKLAQAALARGQMPEPAQVRPEEFYNAFDYGDPAPTRDQKVACRIEQAAHPFLQQRMLVRVGLKVANSGRGAGQPLRLTVLLDTSGSMEREDRAAAVRRAMEVLASLLGPDDRVTLIGFARRPRLLVEGLRGDQAGQLVDLVRRTPADGGTNIEEALTLAGQLAQRHFEASAQNRIVLLTDGAANLGNADPAQLAARIEALRGGGIAFDACGVGTDGLDDEILEALTRRGDGRYYVLDSVDDADAGFARQLAGAFRPAAKNVKVQVRFNPARVGAYRLLGFEKHRLREEDFRNDRVDAAELAAEEAAVAVYQVEVLPDGDGELGEVSVRFRDMADGRMVERTWTLPHESRPRAFDLASPSLQLAGVSALLAEKMRGGALGDQIDLGTLAPVLGRLKGHYGSQPRVPELATMFEQLRGNLGR